MITLISKSLALAAILLILACSTVKPLAAPAASLPPDEPAGRTDNFLRELLGRHPEWFDSVLRQPGRWPVQLLYTRIDHGAGSTPKLTRFYFRVDPGNYFYPASTVKLPLAALALQRLREIGMTGVDANSSLITEAVPPFLSGCSNDPTAPDGRPTIGHYVKKILVASDNEAFNRLYEFLGQEYIHQEFRRMGYDSAQILHRLGHLLPEAANRSANPVLLYDAAGRKLFTEPLRHSKMPYAVRNDWRGTGYYRNGALVREPFDFSRKNRLALEELHSMLEGLVYPQSVAPEKRFRISEEDRRFLLFWMSRYPKESGIAGYEQLADTYVKFLFYGAEDPVQPSIRIFNKVGDAYGFLVDAAYIADREHGVEFFLSAVISCNSDGIYNDDRYDYEKVGYPFLKHLGQALYQYERNRSRQIPARLDALPW